MTKYYCHSEKSEMDSRTSSGSLTELPKSDNGTGTAFETKPCPDRRTSGTTGMVAAIAKEKNRQAQRRFRARQKEMISELKTAEAKLHARIKELEQLVKAQAKQLQRKGDTSDLQSQVDLLQAENETLKAQLALATSCKESLGTGKETSSPVVPSSGHPYPAVPAVLPMAVQDASGSKLLEVHQLDTAVPGNTAARPGNTVTVVNTLCQAPGPCPPGGAVQSAVQVQGGGHGHQWLSQLQSLEVLPLLNLTGGGASCSTGGAHADAHATSVVEYSMPAAVQHMPSAVQQQQMVSSTSRTLAPVLIPGPATGTTHTSSAFSAVPSPGTSAWDGTMATRLMVQVLHSPRDGAVQAVQPGPILQLPPQLDLLSSLNPASHGVQIMGVNMEGAWAQLAAMQQTMQSVQHSGGFAYAVPIKMEH